MREPYIVERHAIMVSNDSVLLLFTVKTKAVFEGYKTGQSLKELSLEIYRSSNRRNCH